MCSIPFSLNDHSEPFAFSLPLSDDLTQIIFFLYAAPSVTLIHTMSERPSRGTWRFNVFVQRWSVFYKVWVEKKKKKTGLRGKKKSLSVWRRCVSAWCSKDFRFVSVYIMILFLFNCWTVREEGREEKVRSGGRQGSGVICDRKKSGKVEKEGFICQQWDLPKK